MTARPAAARFRDQVAVVGVGVSPYTRAMPRRSAGAAALEACIAAIRDAGVPKEAIDGLAGDSLLPQYVQTALGLPALTWWSNHGPPFSNQLLAAVHAVHAGICDYALVYQARSVQPGRSKKAAGDPLRSRSSLGLADRSSYFGVGHLDTGPGSLFGVPGYAAWAGRYLHDHGARREHLGLVALNGRSHAAVNPNAVLRQPLTMDEYLAAPTVWSPLGVLDMELPVDGGDAFVITTVDRARDLPQPPVLVHAAAMGQAEHNDETTIPDLEHSGQRVAARRLWADSDIDLDAIDIAALYDGFSFITLCWLESLGFCKTGEAGPMLESDWDRATGQARLAGRLPLNPHGGNLSEGGTGGAGHLREAVVQVRGTAGDRQIPAAATALVAIGGLFMNSSALILRAAGC